MIQNLFTFILFLFIGVLPLKAQFSRLDIEHITEKNGLPNNRISSIDQDKKGFIWIATSDGLCKYDAYNFQIFKPNPDNPYSICGNIVRCMDIAENGNVWVGTDDGLSCYDQKTERFINYTQDPEKPGVYIEKVEHICTAKSGDVWFLNDQSHITRLNAKTNKFHHYFVDSIIKNIATDVHVDANENVWFTSKYGVCMLKKENIETGKFIVYKYDQTNPLGLKKSTSNGNFYLDRDKKLWFNNKKQACRIDSFNNKELFLTRLFNNKSDNINLNKTKRIHQSIDGNYWILTEGAILLNYQTKTDEILQYAYSQNNPSGLSQSIDDLYCDKSGVMWVMCGYEGINKFKVSSNQFKLIQHIPSNPSSLESSLIFCLTSDKKGNVWFGSTNKSISRFNYKDNELHNIKRFNKTNIFSDIHDIIFDDEDNMWIATAVLEKLVSEDINSNSFFFQEQRPDENSHNKIHAWNLYSLLEDNEGNIWAPNGSALSKLPHTERNNSNLTFTNYYYKKNDPRSIIKENTWSIFQDSKGIIWMGTNNGLSAFNPNTGLSTNYYHSFTDTNSISNDNVKCIHETKDGVIWFGTEGGGLNRFNEKTKAFTAIRSKQGLPNEIVWGILEDDNGYLWLNTNAGISRFNPKDNSIKNYPINAESKSNHYGKKGYCKDINGVMYFVGLDGIIYFHPDSIKTNKYAPPIIITNFKIFNTPIAIGEKKDGKVILKKSISETEKINLSWKHNSFTFEFASLDFSNPKNNKYKYIMEGFNDNWIETDASKRYATYTNLDAGKYTFKVKGSNSDGVWNNNEASIVVITITPPFWETIVFRVSFLLFIILGTFLAIKYRINILQKQKDELEDTVKERTAEILNQKEEMRVQAENLIEVNSLLTDHQKEIEQQAKELVKLNNTKDKFFSIIAHDLKNPFHAISGMSSLLNKSWEIIDASKKKEFIEMIEVSSKGASTLLENLLQWSRTQTNQIQHKPTNFSITEIINETVNLLMVNASKKKIELVSDIKGDSNVFADQNMITTVIRNLINNAIKFTKENGKITIKGNELKEFYQIEVIDNGIGMPEKVRSKLFRIDEPHSTTGTSGEGGTGLGLIICKEFVEKNGGQIEVESKLNRGSTFRFTLPKKAQ